MNKRDRNRACHLPSRRARRDERQAGRTALGRTNDRSHSPEPERVRTGHSRPCRNHRRSLRPSWLPRGWSQPRPTRPAVVCPPSRPGYRSQPSTAAVRGDSPVAVGWAVTCGTAAKPTKLGWNSRPIIASRPAQNKSLCSFSRQRIESRTSQSWKRSRRLVHQGGDRSMEVVAGHPSKLAQNTG